MPMRSRSFIIEALLLAFIVLVIQLISSNDAIVTVVLETLLSMCLIALNGIIKFQRARICLNVIVCLLILFLGPSYILLLPLVYVATFDIGYWSALALVLALFINPSQYLFSLLGIFGIYIAIQSQRITQQRMELNHVRDSLTEEQLQMKSQQKEMLHTKQQDIDIAILSERNRISRELHDAIGHSLARSIIQIEALMVMNNNELIDKQLNQLQLNLRTGMDDIRHTIHHLHHESLDFQASISNLQDEFQPLIIQFDLITDTVFKYNEKKDILTVIREALINSVKHSNSTQVNIILQEFPEHTKLLIKDNGTNYEPSEHHTEGMGKTIIRQIAQRYDAPILFYYRNGYIVQMNIPK